MPKGIPLTTEEQNRKRRDVFAASLPLFLGKGFYETSMKEIAEACGMGKSTLYDYFKTKDEILVAFAEEEVMVLTARVQEIAARPAPAEQRLREVMQAHLVYMEERKEFFLKLYIEMQRLDTASLMRIQKKRHIYQDLLCGLIEEGIREGAFRPVQPLLATRTLLSLLNPVVFTSRPTGTPEEMLEEIIGIFFKGIVA